MEKPSFTTLNFFSFYSILLSFIIFFQLIISWAKKEKLFVAPCASTGLAASDLIDGQTAHSRFKIKPDVKDDTEPIIYDGQLLSEVIRLTDLIILDEVSALHVNVLKFIDKSCRMADKQRAFHQDSTTLEETPIPFASKVNFLFIGYLYKIRTYFFLQIVILGGDWKQLAPIEKDVDIRFPDKRNMHLAQSKASIKNSEYFEASQPYHFRTTRLRTNNRLLPGQHRFRDFLKVCLFLSHLFLTSRLPSSTFFSLLELASIPTEIFQNEYKFLIISKLILSRHFLTLFLLMML